MHFGCRKRHYIDIHISMAALALLSRDLIWRCQAAAHQAPATPSNSRSVPFNNPGDRPPDRPGTPSATGESLPAGWLTRSGTGLGKDQQPD